MSKYTTEVRYICETNAGLKESKGYNSIAEIIANSRTKIFDFDYPIYDESYRSVLETKILKHYYTREIGLETVGLWKLKLDTKMNEIMPYYNQLYRSALIEFNPMYTTDLYTTGNKDTQGESNGNERSLTEREITGKETNEDILEIESTETGNKTLNSEANKSTDETANESKTIEKTGSKNVEGNVSTDRTSTTTSNETKRDKYSDTPQGSLVDLEADKYLTNARKITDENTSTTVEDIDVHSEEVTATTESETDSGQISKDISEETTVESTETSSDSTERTDTRNITKDTITNDNTNGTRNNTNEFTNTEQYLEHVYGFSNRDASELLLKYRKTFLNIDLQIIDELEELFLHLW